MVHRDQKSDRSDTIYDQHNKSDAPILFNKSDLRKIKRLYIEKFGITLDDQAAFVKLCLLVKQLELISKPQSMSL